MGSRAALPVAAPVGAEAAARGCDRTVDALEVYGMSGGDGWVCGREEGYQRAGEKVSVPYLRQSGEVLYFSLGQPGMEHCGLC